MSIVLGATYKERITGFTGVATGHCHYLTGCSQVLIQPGGLTADGKVKESTWWDEQRLEEVQGSEVVVLNNSSTPGCDKKAPKR